MTDNEIIKELQSASEWFSEHGRNTNTAIIGICDRAVALINRQKAEIERLTKANEIFAVRNTLDKTDEVLELKSKGYTIRYIAKKVGYSERHIYRILKQRKEDGKNG